MEIMYSNKYNSLVKKNSFTGIYGDKIDLVNNGVDLFGITYDDEWTVRRFLNGYKLKLDSNILEIFSSLEISYSLLKKKIKQLSKGQFKLVLFVYVILNNKNTIVFDYFDKGLSYKYKKRIINYLKGKYNGTLIAISNDILFLNMLCNNIIVFEDGNIVFNGEFLELYKSRVKLNYPEIIKFIRLVNKNKVKLSYNYDNKELLTDLYILDR